MDPPKTSYKTMLSKSLAGYTENNKKHEKAMSTKSVIVKQVPSFFYIKKAFVHYFYFINFCSTASTQQLLHQNIYCTTARCNRSKT
jgi:hypothetical protein